MQITIDDVITKILLREGRNVRRSDSKSGPVKYGIDQSTLSVWRNCQATPYDVVSLTEQEARQIYRSLYVERPGFALIEEPLRSILVDCAICSGPATAIKWLQEALNVPTDALIGPVTRIALEKADKRVIAKRVLASRIRYIGRLISRHKPNANLAESWLTRIAEIVERM